MCVCVCIEKERWMERGRETCVNMNMEMLARAVLVEVVVGIPSSIASPS